MLNTFYFGFALLAVSPTAAETEVLDAFASPEVKYRPKFRYWLPDASVPVEVVQHDIASVSEIGGGGIELLPFYNYGCPACDDGGYATPTDWSIYGFGTEAYHEVFKAALQAARDNGVLLDFAQGGSQGQGVPAEPETLGLAMELSYVNLTVAPGKFFSGVLPFSTQPEDHSTGAMHKLENFGKQRLFAVSAAEIVSAQGEEVVLGEILDLTHSVVANRSLSWKPPAGNSTWRLFAWYERYTNQRSVTAGPNATNFIQNGSWIVDHFSNAGAQLITKFFDEYVVVDNQTAELMATSGKYAWEDSMEMSSALWWTPGFQDMFYERNGYNISRCLPLLIVKDNGWAQSTLPYDEAFVSLDETFQHACNEDYRAILNDGYQKYLAQRKLWAHLRGIEFSAQTAYNLPIDRLADIPLVDAPEGESFGFNDNMDRYRQFSGPAHVTGTPVVSSELGASSGAPFQQTVNDLLWSVRRGLATGISMHVFHGFAYSGRYPNSTWPTWTVMSYLFTEMWNQHQPSWRHMNDSMKYISRNQYISQAGTPKIDLAFYQYSAPWTPADGYHSSSLERLGYTYDYLSPALFEKVTAEDRLLVPEGPAYKALIFSNQTKISSKAATKVQEFAHAGLPIFFLGASTNFTGIGLVDRKSGSAAQTMSNILSSGLDNVYTVPSPDDLPAALSRAAIQPMVQLSNGTRDWYSFWRVQDSFTHVFLYNEGIETQTSEVEFSITDATPYIFNAWTGSISPVLRYVTTESHTRIPITLAANQTTIIGFSTNATAAGLSTPKAHVTECSGSVAGLTYANGSLYAQLSGPATLTLSNGTTRNMTASPPPPSTLTSWNISIEDWHSTADIFSMDTAITYRNYSDVPLSSWLALDPALASASGVGTYRTTFARPGGGCSDRRTGAILHLGPVTNTIRARLNGKLLPPIDVADAVLDVSGHVSAGRNELEVEITTTLFNRVKADADDVWTSGITANMANGAYYQVNAPKEYGLIGPVWIEWVEMVRVA